MLQGLLNNRRPILSTEPIEVKKPNIGKFSTPLEKWSFSLEYFRQIEYFGLGNTDTKWFVSLLDRLKTFSEFNPQKFEQNHSIKIANRYHKINWNSKNIPYQRSDFDWLPLSIRDNEEDFPFFQFQVSTGLGRVIGFWDLHKTFQIVLLDPAHNMQPSKNYNYKVDDTVNLVCEMTSLLIDVEAARDTVCSDDACAVKSKLHVIPSKLNRGNFVYAILEDDYYDELEKALQTKTFRSIIELGLLSE